MTDAIYYEVYRGHKIEIFTDGNAESPSEWCDNGAFLVHYHRNCWIVNDGVITQDKLRLWYQGEKIEQLKDYFIFAVSAYIHGGVRLSLENTFPADGYGWDTSHVGAVLVSKKETKSKAGARTIAQGTVNIWNDYLSGNVYGYVVDGDESCWGYYGDYDNPKDGGALQAARESIDNKAQSIHKKQCTA